MLKRSLGATLLLALLAGLLGGLMTAAFHWFLTEPVLQQAIDLETSANHAAHPEVMVEVVSRPVQRIGLFIGYLIYGAAWGVLFGVARWFVGAFVPRRMLNWLALILAGIIGWAIGVLPQIKFPSNPPGVESLQSVDYRQILYLGFLILSAAEVLVASLFYRYLGRLKNTEWQKPLKRLRVVAPLYLGLMLLTLLVFPAITMVESVPADLLATFRLLSLLGVIIFWAGIGGSYTLLDRFMLVSKRKQAEPNTALV